MSYFGGNILDKFNRGTLDSQVIALEKIIKLLLANGADPDLLTVRGDLRKRCQDNYAGAPEEYKPLLSLVINHEVANQHLEDTDIRRLRK